MSRKIIAFLLIFCLVFEQSGFAQVASVADLSAAFASVSSFDKFRPMHLRSLSLDRGRNDFNLFVDKGDVRKFPPAEVKESADKLMEYFQIGITLPDSAFWVNLRPDGADTIIDPALEKTDVGKVLLEADLALKKDMARATSPKTKEGRVYWNKLYAKAESLFGSREVSIPTLTRPWIVPGEIIVRQSPESAYVYKAGLVVKLEQDHLRDSSAYKFNDPRLQELNEYSTRLIRELILPQLTKKVNSSRSYAALRQVFYSLVLAKWFKERFQGSQARYADRIDTGDLSGLTSREAWSKDTYFQAYRKSFAEGEYTARESVPGAGGASMRSYASGGINGLMTEARPMIVPQRSGIVPGRGNLQFDGGRITVIGSQAVEAEQPRAGAVTVSPVKTDGGKAQKAAALVSLVSLAGLAAYGFITGSIPPVFTLGVPAAVLGFSGGILAWNKRSPFTTIFFLVVAGIFLGVGPLFDSAWILSNETIVSVGTYYWAIPVISLFYSAASGVLATETAYDIIEHVKEAKERLNGPQQSRRDGGMAHDLRLKGYLWRLNHSWTGGQTGVIEALGDLKDARAVESLISRLSDDRDYIVSGAIAALRKIGDPRAEGPIQEVLGSGKAQDFNIRIEVARALAYFHGTKSREILLTMMRTEITGYKAEAVIIEAIQSLERYYPEGAGEMLVPMLFYGDSQESYRDGMIRHRERAVRTEAADSLRRLGLQDRIASEYLAALQGKDERHVRYALENVDSPAVEPFVRSLLLNADGAVRDAAQAAYRRIGGENAPQKIQEVYGTAVSAGDRDQRLFALQGLGVMRNAGVFEMLVPATRDPDPLIRATAIRAVGANGSEQGYPILLNALQDTDKGVRSEAVAAIKQVYGWIGGKAAIVTALTAALESPDAGVRLFAINSLGRMRDLTAIPPLARALNKNPVGQEARAAVTALQNLGGEVRVRDVTGPYGHDSGMSDILLWTAVYLNGINGHVSFEEAAAQANEARPEVAAELIPGHDSEIDTATDVDVGSSADYLGDAGDSLDSADQGSDDSDADADFDSGDFDSDSGDGGGDFDGGSAMNDTMRTLLRDLRGLAYRPLSQSRKAYDAALDARIERSLGDRESFEGFRSFVAAQARKEGKLLNYGGAGFAALLAVAVLTAPFPPVQLAALIFFAAWTAGFVLLGSRAADTSSILHRLNALSTSVIAVSIGGTKLGAAPVTWSGRILKPVEIKWQSRFKTVAKQAKPEAVVDVMLAQIEEAVRANRLPSSVVRTVGISFAGPVDPDAGIVGTPFAAPNLPFDHYDLKGVMEEKLEKRYGRHISVEIENDCVAALKGELSPLGGLHKWRSGTVFLIGTGVNGATAVAGKPYAGTAGEIVELGHNIVPAFLVAPEYVPAGYKGSFFYTGFVTKGGHPKDSAGKLLTGDFEDLLSGPNLDAEFARYGLTLKGITAKAIQGDPFAVKLIRDAGIRIGTALAAFIWAYRNEPFVRHIVLVSGVAENLGKGVKAASGQDLFIAAVREGTVDELSRMGISGQEAKDIAAGIERSTLGYERELVAFTPVPSRDGGQAGALDRLALRRKGEVLNSEIQTLVQPKETVSGGVAALNRKKYEEPEKDGGTVTDPVGGIDMRGMKVLTQPARADGGMAGPAVMVPLAQLDARWKDIRLEMARGVTPYLKIKEYVAACGGREDAGKQLKEAATCVADILKADEEKAAETCAEMKEIIVQLG